MSEDTNTKQKPQTVAEMVEFFSIQPRAKSRLATALTDDVVKTLKAEGRRFEVTQSYIDITRTNRNRHVYLDSIDHPGTMVQLMMHDPLYIKLFGMIKHAADTWDGSDPIRPIGVLLEGLLAGTGADWKHGDGD